MQCNGLLLLASTAMVSGVSFTQGAHDLALRDVSVFDSRDAIVTEGKTILIDGGFITAIVDAAQEVDAQEVLDGNGRLVVPGFVDTHFHLKQNFSTDHTVMPAKLEEDQHAYYLGILAERHLAHGTTTLMEMAQPEAWIEASIGWQQDPKPDFPNLFIVGGALNSSLAWDTETPAHHVKLQDPASARAKVREYAELGIERLKLYWKLEAPEMEAVVEEANAHGMRLFAHIDNNIAEINDALDLGVRHFEHFFTLIPGSLVFRNHNETLRATYGIGEIGTIDEFSAMMVLYFEYVRSNPELRGSLLALLDRFAEQKATISTALNVLAAAAGRSSVFTSFNYFPEREAPDLPSYSEEAREMLHGAFDSMLHFLKVAHDKGVKLRIGTDSRGGGEALLSELMLLSEAGLSVGDILRIATWNGADAIGVGDRLGSIEPGKQADLILFAKNPFEDPANFLSEKTVIKGGKLFGGER